MKKWALVCLWISSSCFAYENVELLISPEQISQKIEEVATVLNNDYAGEELTVIMVMKGALLITADLIRAVDVPINVEYISASSYGKNGMSRGTLVIDGIEKLDLEGKNVLVVDDILDTGHTMHGIMAQLQEKNPKSLKSLVLLMKNIHRDLKYRPDYVLFDVENRFVIGYGLDYLEYCREMPGIYAFINDTPPEKLYK